MNASIEKIMIGHYTLTINGTTPVTMNFSTRREAKRAAKRMGCELVK